jgi:hypothetical protein
MTATLFEQAILNAYEFSTGMAALALVQDLVERSQTEMTGFTDEEITSTARIAAYKDVNDANNALSLIASTQAVAGISA